MFIGSPLIVLIACELLPSSYQSKLFSSSGLLNNLLIISALNLICDSLLLIINLDVIVKFI